MNFYMVMLLIGIIVVAANIFIFMRLIKYGKIYFKEKTLESKIDFSKSIIRFGTYFIGLVMYIYYLYISLAGVK